MNEDVKSENLRIHSRADELIACLEGEIAKRDEVIVGLANSRDFWREKAITADDELAAIKAQGVVMPAELDRAFITGESCDGVYRVVIQSETLKEMQSVHRWLARLNAAPVQQVSVPECYARLLKHAFGMTFGVDWNRGTAAETHRNKLIEAVFDCRHLLADAPAAPAADAWIPVSERLPDSGSTVIAYYLNSYGKGRTIRAQHVESWTIEAEDVADADAECVDYSEQDDCYYLLQGWYECIDNWDEYYRVAVTEGPITHWMSLPAAPIKIEANRHDQ